MKIAGGQKSSWSKVQVKDNRGYTTTTAVAKERSGGSKSCFSGTVGRPWCLIRRGEEQSKESKMSLRL